MTLAAADDGFDPEGRNAFDFLFGRWTVRHRQLKQRHVGGDDWRTYEGTASCEPRLGGLANVEEHHFIGRGGDRGLALRLFEPATGEWSIWWASDRDGVLQPPVRGRFSGAGCVLEGDDVDEGRPIRARYVWSDTDTEEPRWEQAFSVDGGRTWETNWVMLFRRAVD
ncbi:MAG TPA: DUF1579 domain-containing protein [Reyranella sp.]|nr:DUF1579 domain-containing protein [Reyranella sp.]